MRLHNTRRPAISVSRRPAGRRGVRAGVHAHLRRGAARVPVSRASGGWVPARGAGGSALQAPPTPAPRSRACMHAAPAGPARPRPSRASRTRSFPRRARPPTAQRVLARRRQPGGQPGRGGRGRRWHPHPGLPLPAQPPARRRLQVLAGGRPAALPQAVDCSTPPCWLTPASRNFISFFHLFFVLCTTSTRCAAHDQFWQVRTVQAGQARAHLKPSTQADSWQGKPGQRRRFSPPAQNPRPRTPA